mmetsp:Transcript_15614/g.29057  ORF Transcript_15614/g.29057 Transcript_15614/m.29057 type:complete len:325 (+) Transcript_15614:306-1280(+)
MTPSALSYSTHPLLNRPNSHKRESSTKKNENRILLGSNYFPGDNAVICGRGKVCSSSAGNLKLKSLVESFANAYSKAESKERKSLIVTAIISSIEQAPGGLFVKFEEGAWWRVDETYAREKIGYMFRDFLHTQYRSSSKAKQARKQMNPAKSGVIPRGKVFNEDKIKNTYTIERFDHNRSVWSLCDRVSPNCFLNVRPVGGRAVSPQVTLTSSLDSSSSSCNDTETPLVRRSMMDSVQLAIREVGTQILELCDEAVQIAAPRLSAQRSTFDRAPQIGLERSTAEPQQADSDDAETISTFVDGDMFDDFMAGEELDCNDDISNIF